MSAAGSGTVTNNLNGDVVTDMPLNVYGGRQAEYFAVALAPGYSPLSDPYLAVINGNQGFTKDFTIDGTTGTAQIQGDIFETGPSMEAIEELHAETSGLSAKNGNTNGGLIMLNLKSGTNAFHGRVYEDFRNDWLNANSWDNDFNIAQTRQPGQPVPKAYRKNKVIWNEFGGSVGGPIIKNKLFFFGTFAMKKVPGVTPAYAWMLTPAAQAGNFVEPSTGNTVNVYNLISSCGAPCAGSAPLPTSASPTTFLPALGTTSTTWKSGTIRS